MPDPLSVQTIIAGIDEAGRGALAGPVVAGACVLPFSLFRRKSASPQWSPNKNACPDDCLIADSKKLSSEQRERAYQWITASCHYGIGIASHAMIEKEGILAATEHAMQRALLLLQRTCAPTFLLIDGRDHFWFDLPHSSVIRGDAIEPCIAAASILAKVTRDRLMCMHDRLTSLYGFAEHKGYGTAAHIHAIRTRGPSSIHRMSFLSRILPSQEAVVRGTKNHTHKPKRKSGIV